MRPSEIYTNGISRYRIMRLDGDSVEFRPISRVGAVYRMKVAEFRSKFQLVLDIERQFANTRVEEDRVIRQGLGVIDIDLFLAMVLGLPTPPHRFTRRIIE